MKKILVALDGSECALRGVDYCANLFSGRADISFTLLHVLPPMPPEMWDPGHIPSEQEEKDRQALVDKWFDNRARRVDAIFERASQILLKANVDPDEVELKIISDSINVAETILEEAKKGNYLTLVLGRCGAPSGIKEFFLGSTANRIIHRGAGLAICVVE